MQKSFTGSMAEKQPPTGSTQPWCYCLQRTSVVFYARHIALSGGQFPVISASVKISPRRTRSIKFLAYSTLSSWGSMI